MFIIYHLLNDSLPTRSEGMPDYRKSPHCPVIKNYFSYLIYSVLLEVSYKTGQNVYATTLGC